MPELIPSPDWRPTRRALLAGGGVSLASLALAELLRAEQTPVSGAGPHHAPKAKRVVYLHMAGAPSQLDLFDPKPKLAELDGQDCPASYLSGERFAFIKGTPKILGSPHAFAREARTGFDFSALVPGLSSVADKLCVVRSMRTTQFNHVPAQILMQTGHFRMGRPSFGAWTSYGLGALASDLPSFVVLTSGRYGPDAGASLWGAGFLPGVHQGVRFLSHGDPVLHLADPEGCDRDDRRRTLDAIGDLNRLAARERGDPEIETRIAQYELAYRMQASVPELVDFGSEPAHVLERYGAKADEPSFARNCVLARRLLEQGVRFVQLYHWGWDSHGTSPGDDIVTSLPQRCQECDRPSAALLAELDERGLLEDTLFVWGGEFGRTPMNEARDGSKFLGRDHHPHAFTMLLAGGGLKRGFRLGATDELGYFVSEDPVTPFDLNATLLHLLGFDHERLTYRFQGRDFRLTDVEGAVLAKLLA
ncbi:MAG: DUF1501 domain-containing protein [Planctomycetes bacterium]|nr:DUF1501 domain-containing protein [Planctomycetota bacterium]